MYLYTLAEWWKTKIAATVSEKIIRFTVSDEITRFIIQYFGQTSEKSNQRIQHKTFS